MRRFLYLLLGVLLLLLPGCIVWGIVKSLIAYYPEQSRPDAKEIDPNTYSVTEDPLTKGKDDE